MKVAIYLFLVVVVVSIEALPQSLYRNKRGFRMGVADRFSHGFGKRTDSLHDITDSRMVLTNEELAAILRSNPEIAYNFVRRFLDVDGDGLVTEDELYNGVRPSS